jgi:hypothetical protein
MGRAKLSPKMFAGATIGALGTVPLALGLPGSAAATTHGVPVSRAGAVSVHQGATLEHLGLKPADPSFQRAVPRSAPPPSAQTCSTFLPNGGSCFTVTGHGLYVSWLKDQGWYGGASATFGSKIHSTVCGWATYFKAAHGNYSSRHRIRIADKQCYADETQGSGYFLTNGNAKSPNGLYVMTNTYNIDNSTTFPTGTYVCGQYQYQAQSLDKFVTYGPFYCQEVS